jgi:cytidyltransferase-like protein
MKHVVVTGPFDDLRSSHLRFLEEASKLGGLTILLWPDSAVARLTGQPPKFPAAERLYLLSAVRHVAQVRVASEPVQAGALPEMAGLSADVWVVGEAQASTQAAAQARARGLDYRILPAAQTAGYPKPPRPASIPGGRKRVVVTGCYDWFHSGHVRFFEEVSAYGDLYVIVGHDANIRLLKGEGHPLFPQEERRYMVGSIRFVTQALISSGDGWLDADPEIRQLKPDIYAVNEDGDKGGKREYCAKLGLEYLVLRRTPAPGLAQRSSTRLRGF